MGQAYTNDILRWGHPGGGLNLNKSIDALSPLEFSRLNNLYHTGDLKLSVRLGLSLIATAGTLIHSIGRLNDPQSGAPTIIWGVDDKIYRGISGTLSLIDSGFSGLPLNLVPYRPVLSGDTWMFIGDSTRMRKVNTAGLSLPIGLPAPSVAATTALISEVTKSIDEFEGGWNGFPGDGGPPILSYGAGKTANALFVTCASAGATAGFYNFVDKAIGPLDLTSLPGAIISDDNDLIHLYIKCFLPDGFNDLKIYFTSGVFTSGFIPGTDANHNLTGFMKMFTADDLAGIIAQEQTVIQGSQQAVINETVDDSLAGQTQGAPVLATTNPSGPRAVREQLGLGFDWTEFGGLVAPLRKLDFLKIGENPVWSNITGMTIVISCKLSNVVSMGFDNCFLQGGYGLDATGAAAGYDYRYTYYDPRTGAESNPSPTQPDASFLFALRQQVQITPTPFGDASIRQKIYRRGGTLPTDWNFLAINVGDGSIYLDGASDNVASAGDNLTIDHDQPVTSVDKSGNTILAAPCPALWGPIQDLLFACGDIYQPGVVYFSKAGEPDHWPATNTTEVCSPSEQLMAGCVWADQSYVFSRQRLYHLYVNLTGSAGVTGVPTACKKGLVSRWGLAPSREGIYFIADDGIYLTTGGGATLISDMIRPLFNAQVVNDYQPIDFSVPNGLRLVIFNNDLWFFYQDVLGGNQVLIWSTIYQYWRAYQFSTPILTGFNDELAGFGPTLILTSSFGKAYFHQGTSDNNSFISASMRTGALDQGISRNLKLYGGDVVVDADPSGSVITLTPYFDNESTVGLAQTLSGSGRTLHHLTPFDGTQRYKNISFDLSWAANASSSIFWLGYTWMALPMAHVRWETDVIDHGVLGWHMPLMLYITLRSTTDVTVSVVTYDAAGGSTTSTYLLPSTSGNQIKSVLYLNATKGVGFKYTFTSSTPFLLYWDQSSAIVQPISAAPEDRVTYVLGTDSPSQVGNPSLQAMRSGGRV